jgi:hypothetical protein
MCLEVFSSSTLPKFQCSKNKKMQKNENNLPETECLRPQVKRWAGTLLSQAR